MQEFWMRWFNNWLVKTHEYFQNDNIFFIMRKQHLKWDNIQIKDNQNSQLNLLRN